MQRQLNISGWPGKAPTMPQPRSCHRHAFGTRQIVVTSCLDIGLWIGDNNSSNLTRYRAHDLVCDVTQCNANFKRSMQTSKNQLNTYDAMMMLTR